MTYQPPTTWDGFRRLKIQMQRDLLKRAGRTSGRLKDKAAAIDMEAWHYKTTCDRLGVDSMTGEDRT